jgi:transposase InsO family protein
MQRLEFIEFARQSGANVRELCRRYGVSPTTAYKWLRRHREQGSKGLEERSRRPHSSSRQTSAGVERLVVEVHGRFPYRGARKLRQVLYNEGHRELPAASTIAMILERHGCQVRTPVSQQAVYQRFVHAEPNRLWQMDFKGDFAMRSGRCHPLTVLDDHSRFALCLKACPAVNGGYAAPALEQVFRRFGLPERILCDNAGPWGTSDKRARFTAFGVWLLRLGVDIIHGRPLHPQTQGKCERFHRSFKVEVLNRSTPWRDLAHCQSHFDEWRESYNHVRPHHALDLATPASHYRPSLRAMPVTLPLIEYLPEDHVRAVKSKGEITFRNHFFFIGAAFAGLPLALRPALPDGRFDVFFSWKKLGSIDLASPLKPKFRYNPVLP